jgi:hypothetical protein
LERFYLSLKSINPEINLKSSTIAPLICMMSSFVR